MIKQIKNLFLAAIIPFTFTSHLIAQELYLKGGITFASLNLQSTTTRGMIYKEFTDPLILPSTSISYDYSATPRLRLTTELSYFSGGGLTSVTELGNPDISWANQPSTRMRLNYLGLSQLVTINIFNIRRFEFDYKVGPSFNYFIGNLKDPSTPLYFLTQTTQTFQKFGIGIKGNLEFSYRLNKLIIIAEINNSIRLNRTVKTTTNQNLPNNLSDLSATENQFFINLGLGFYLNK